MFTVFDFIDDEASVSRRGRTQSESDYSDYTSESASDWQSESSESMSGSESDVAKSVASPQSSEESSEEEPDSDSEQLTVVVDCTAYRNDHDPNPVPAKRPRICKKFSQADTEDTLEIFDDELP